MSNFCFVINLSLCLVCESGKICEFSQAPVISYKNGFIYFGGRIYVDKIVDKLENAKIDQIFHLSQEYKWEQIGRLSNARYGHSVAEFNGDLLIIGGFSNYFLKTEKCTFTEGKNLECKGQEPSLKNYVMWPELMKVGPNYCE